jgi:NAD(P)H-nitrite reductase large subunit
MHHIIIGAGPAGIVAAETLKKADPAARVTIIGDEPEPPYSRMAIPYYLVDNIDESGSYLRGSGEYYLDQGIDLMRQRVQKVDAENRRVLFEGGESLGFDRLLLATGSRPFTPPIPGVDLPQVQSCWTLADARAIIELAQPGSNVVLVGAGFIGCIILEALIKRGVKLSVVETGDRMVPRMLNDKAGGLLREWCVNKGVNVYTSNQVQSIAPAGSDQVKVTLSDGSELPAALVITATGVKPNLELIEGSGIAFDRGILVDEHMQTSQPGIYAAGDVAQARDFSSGENEVQAIQPTATEHGRIAALNMAGREVKHQGCLNMNVLDTLGLISCSFGAWMGVEGGEQAELYNPEAFQYVNLQFDGNHLVGASSVGKTQHVGVLRGLIESRIDLGEWKDRLIEDPLNWMEAYMARTQELGYQ